MPHGWLPTQCTNYWSVVIPWEEKIWLRSRRSRVLKIVWVVKSCFVWAEALADTVIERHRKRLHGRARLITIRYGSHR